MGDQGSLPGVSDAEAPTKDGGVGVGRDVYSRQGWHVEGSDLRQEGLEVQ